MPTALLLQEGEAQLEGPRRLAVGQQQLGQLRGVAVARERELRQPRRLAEAAAAVGQQLRQPWRLALWQQQLRQPRLVAEAAEAA